MYVTRTVQKHAVAKPYRIYAVNMEKRTRTQPQTHTHLTYENYIKLQQQQQQQHYTDVYYILCAKRNASDGYALFYLTFAKRAL